MLALVLIHGLGRTSRSMLPLARAAGRRGYEVFNLGYPSRTAGTEALAERVAHAVEPFRSGEALDFVTHSMGGILLRAAVAAGLVPLDRVRRAVLLAPPNGGSEVADLLGHVPHAWRATGPALLDLRTGERGLVERLPPLPFDCGVIAGTRTVNPLFSLAIPGPDDGKVSVARARVAGAADVLVVPRTHPFIMRAPAVHAQVFHFLATGAFLRATDRRTAERIGAR